MNRRIRDNRYINNKGFSLVELLIAVAIASIVGVAVFGFMRVGAQTFSFNSSDVNLQSESQLAFNQMQELIIDTAVGVQYFSKTPTPFDPESPTAFDDSSLTEVGADSEIGSTDDKLLRLNNKDSVYDIWWDRDEGKLYYNEWTAHLDITSGEVVRDSSSPDIADSALMSEYIHDFSVDLSRLPSRVVRVDFRYEKGDRVQSYSHNITLRNQIVSGNKVEEKIKDAFTVSENVLPQDPEGKDYIYVEAGETINLTSVEDDAAGGTGLTGYHVKDSKGAWISTTGADAKETLLYGFKNAGDHVAATTIGYSSGVLHVDNTQDSDFDILVYCQSDNSKQKTVHIRVVRDLGIDIAFTKGAGAKDEVVNSDFSDDLIVNETFDLTATPNINYTTANVTDPALTPSDITKLSGIETRINDGIYFKGGTGYNTLFREDPQVGGNPTQIKLESGVTPCKFKMFGTFNFSAVSSDASSPISVFAVCGYSEERSKDISTEWTGAAYKKKTTNTSKNTPDGDVNRSRLMSIEKNSKGLTCSKGGDFDKNHVWLIDGKVTERNWDIIDEQGYPQENDVDFSTFVRAEGGNVRKWRLPYEMNPNCDYTIMITVNIAHIKPGDTASGGTMQVLPYGGYTENDYEFIGNTSTYFFDRLRITYSGKKDYENVIFTDTPNAEEGNHATYYMRDFQRDLASTSGVGKTRVKSQYWDGYDEYPNTITFPITYSKSYMPSGTELNDECKAGQWLSKSVWNVYEPDENGGWKKYESNLIKRLGANNSFDMNNNEKAMFAFRNTYDGVNTIGFDMYTYKDCINRKIAPRIRIYPVYHYVDSQKGIDYEEEIKDNYIDCIFWNITIPYKSILGNLYAATGWGNSYDIGFFPGPNDPGFPGETSTATLWNYAGYDKSSGYVSGNNNYYNLKYTLSKDSNIDGSSYYRLKLFYEGSGHANIEIANYIYNNGKQVWEIVSPE